MKKILFIITTLLLSNCFGGRTPPSSFYNIVSLSSNNENIKFKTKNNYLIGIEPVIIPNYLARPQIVTIKNEEYELNISEFNRWAEPLSNSLQMAISNNLYDYLENSIIKLSNLNTRNFDYFILIEIDKLDAKFEEKVYLEAWWSLLDKNNNVIFTEKINLELPIKNTYSDLVKNQSELINQLSIKIAEKISTIF